MTAKKQRTEVAVLVPAVQVTRRPEVSQSDSIARPRRRSALRRRWAGLRPVQRVRLVGALAIFVVGLVVGWVLLGSWYVWSPAPEPQPKVIVQPATIDTLPLAERQQLIRAAGHLYAYDPESRVATALITNWNALGIACRMVQDESDAAEQMRIMAVAYRLNNDGCPTP